MKQGDDYDKLLPVVVIIVACFLLCIDLEKLRNTFLIMAEDVPGFVLTEDLQFHIMELVKEKIDRLQNMNSPLRPWLEFFYYGDKKEEEKMRVLLQSGGAEVNEAYDLYLRFNQDEELRQLEEARQQYLHDDNTSINYAKREGEAIGEARGEVRGEARGKAIGEETKAIAVAMNLKGMGMSLADIAKVTGLSPAQVKRLS